ncbi:hypothetical protein IL972_00260 [Acinetobacter sp. FL51]|uniref:hypothetical protein n=1 Tax=Acinetobacter sp. FL51 TaxID=2777978 RepID=UPI0018E1A3DC|nr:hypothetical protein [Acinetobacter sp. FL51]MBI1450370.1 hypothetical protein [Acinetobacter sp. FL51]
MIVIKKSGKYLSYKKIEDEYEYCDLSEVAAIDQSGWCWDSDYEKAKYFMSKNDADIFLTKKKGGFWQGAKVVRK